MVANKISSWPIGPVVVNCFDGKWSAETLPGSPVVVKHLDKPLTGPLGFENNLVLTWDGGSLAVLRTNPTQSLAYVQQSPDKAIFCQTLNTEVGYVLEDVEMPAETDVATPEDGELDLSEGLPPNPGIGPIVP